MEASIELKQLVKTLTDTNEETFIYVLQQWHNKWNTFLKEKTTHPETGRWHFTHKRLRSAYKSLNSNVPYLFTYLQYPHLHIPNTTNSLEGFFNVFKSKIYVHRGLSKKRRNNVAIKLIKGRS